MHMHVPYALCVCTSHGCMYMVPVSDTLLLMMWSVMAELMALGNLLKACIKVACF
jgi:hypothetical protein